MARQKLVGAPEIGTGPRSEGLHKAVAVSALLLVGILTSACGQNATPTEGVTASGQKKAMVLAPGWVTGTTWPTETVVALNSIAARSTSRIDGDVGVVLAGTGTFLSAGSELSLEANAEITGSVRADSIATVATSHIFGDATYNTLTGGGTLDGTPTMGLTVPVPITIVTTSDFTSSGSNLTVSASATTTLTSSTYNYNAVTLNTGTASANTILRLRSNKTYTFASLTLGNYARLECQGSCTIKVKGRVSVGQWSYVGPGSASSTNQNMTKAKLFVEGSNGTAGPTGTPAAAAFGNRSVLYAYTFVPNGTLSLGTNVTGIGKFIAKDVDIGSNTELMTGTSQQRVLVIDYALSSTWPKELITAWNSLEVQTGTALTGNAAVINNGTGSFLSTSEAVIGSSATITGNLSADKIELKSGSRVTGTASYNTIVNTGGTVGTASSPVSMPLDIRVPVFPVVTNGSTSVTVAARVDQTLSAGAYRSLTLSPGITTDYTVLTLTGGLYQFRSMTLGTYSKVICASACEIRVNRNIAAGDFTEIGPTTGLDAGQVKIYVYGCNNNSCTSSPTTTPFAVSIGQNSIATGLLFAPRGTFESKTGATLSGRFIARDVRLGTSTTSVQAGVTELAPEIQTQPAPVTITSGQDASFTVAATGTDVTLQWKRNNVVIPGATAGTYTLTGATVADSGALFTVTVSNAVGYPPCPTPLVAGRCEVTSTAALLTVNACNPATYVPTATSCGVGACARTGTLTCPAGAVVDSCVAGTAAPNDSVCNGIDDDCNGLTDEEYVATPTTCGAGLCPATGLMNCVAGALQNSCIFSTSVPLADTTCDGRDDDCNGQVDEDYVPYATSCGVGACADTGITSCVGGAEEDSCSEGNPGPSDSDCDGVDDNCDGQADEDYPAVATSCGAGACRATGIRDCVDGTVVNSCTPGTNAPSDATCNGVDDDCNGQIDEDYVPVPSSCGVGVCARTSATSCTSGIVQSNCIPGTPAANDMSCNGLDNDCNGQVDEDYVSTTTSCGVGACLRSGTATCVSGSISNSCVAGTPGPSDTSCDGVDQNCNGTADEGYPTTPTTCGAGACTASGVLSCVAGNPHDSCVAGSAAPDDVTCDGIDDNCAGGIDEGYVPVVTSCGSGACATTGMSSCVAGTLHDSCAVPTTDGDGDSIIDCMDLCPLDALNDVDGDAVCANTDNCDTVFNPDQLDTDGDLAGDACDAPIMIAVAAGGEHSCALFQDQVVRCWGNNTNGQLGNGSNVTVASLVEVSGLTNTQEVVAGKSHSCARASTGSVSCWGENASGQLGNGSTTAANAPVAVSGVTTAVQLATGASHSCARLSTGAVACWGDNTYGQLGDGTVVSATSPVTVSGVADAVHITAGFGHTCAVRATGAIACWGYNSYGQLGIGTLVNALLPTAVTGIADAQQVAAGALHTCALGTTGATQCWGANWYGQLGNGTLTDSSIPVAVSGPSDGVQVITGQLHSCAMTATGGLRCWGYNSYGSLGNASITDATTPVAVSGLAGAVQVAAGNLHTCAVENTGQAYCWGDGEQGQLGQGMLGTVLVPTVVVGVAGATGASAGAYTTCAVQATGSVLCWGINGSGELGDGSGLDSNTPTQVSGITDATAVAVGDSHACALHATGSISCWGYGREGQLGDGTAVDASTPVSVSGISTAIAIATGADHTCAVLSGGQVQCWGFGDDGELGDGSNSSASTPVTVTGISNAVAVAGGVSHTCALTSAGTVYCWGLGTLGRLGHGATTSSAIPVQASGISDAIFVAAGDAHSCAVRATSEVRCWGDNTSGQVSVVGGGPAGTNSVLTPTVVGGLSGAQSVGAGAYHSCASLATGQIRCWGDNSGAQLGNGTLVTPPATTLATGISDAISVSTGVAHTCATSAAGTVSCWGNGETGRLGNAYPVSNIPVRVIWP